MDNNKIKIKDGIKWFILLSCKKKGTKVLMMTVLRYHGYYYAYLRFIKVKFCYGNKEGVNIDMHVNSFNVVYKCK